MVRFRGGASAAWVRFRGGASAAWLPFALTLLLCSTLLAYLALSVRETGDYSLSLPVGGDNAAPGIWCLLHGDLLGYAARQPMIGLTSILLRLPFAWLGARLGGGPLPYRLGCLACLLPLALLTAWLVHRGAATRERRTLRLLAMLVVIGNEILPGTLWAGHPEGPLTATLCCAAVLAAGRGEARWAALWLGLALGAKEWALIAVAPVLLALPGRRREVVLIAGGLVGVLCGLVWVADPNGLLRALHNEGMTHLVNQLSPLWALGSPQHVFGGPMHAARVLPLGLSRAQASVVVGGPALALLGGWHVRCRRRGRGVNPMALLALLGLLRCVCDSTHIEYYLAAALIPLAAWEASEDRLPLNTVLFSLVMLLLYSPMQQQVDPWLSYAGSTAAGLGFSLYLTRCAFPAAAAGAVRRAPAKLAEGAPSLTSECRSGGRARQPAPATPTVWI